MAFVPVYIVILGFTIIIDYYAGILIEKAPQKTKRLYLILSLAANIGVLAVFKYYNFLADNISMTLDYFNLDSGIPTLSILLPIGLSFHTFQAMSYTIEVYRGKYPAERNFYTYALYVMFYPQLVAGPIERPQNVLFQFKENHDFNYDRARYGLILIGWGLFKKIVIADRLAIFVNKVFNDPTGFEGIPLIVATAMFSFQIYCDFSGYSDIAIGTAKVMGFDLMQNFDSPYTSKSISEFWKRWHISLSTWFRDYLYIPLGGNRIGKKRTYLNLIVVFLISGLWHGANWTFIVWGFLHGVFLTTSLIVNNFWGKALTRLGSFKLFNFLKMLFTFSLVSMAWIFFRANNIQQALYIITHLFNGVPSDINDIFQNKNLKRQELLYLGQNLKFFLLAIFLIIFLLTIEVLNRKKPIIDWLVQEKQYVRWSIYFAFLFIIMVFGIFKSNEQFIYFQF
jgi:alginate O-acetyltransferase complex protein AlgI